MAVQPDAPGRSERPRPFNAPGLNYDVFGRQLEKLSGSYFVFARGSGGLVEIVEATERRGVGEAVGLGSELLVVPPGV
jgi:hypothetical protein